MHAPAEGRKAYQTTGIFSPDGEYLPLSAPVVLDARPEEWLNWVNSSRLLEKLFMSKFRNHGSSLLIKVLKISSE